MLLRLAVFAVPFLVGCSSPVPSNLTQVDELEQVYEFNVVDKRISLKRSLSFIEDVNKSHQKSLFEVYYDPKESEFVAELIESARQKGIHRHRINATVKGEDSARPDSQPLSEKSISIVTKYTLVNDKHCQTLHMGNASTFQFGCAVEYNRIKSLVKPLKGTE
ncbi:hypothetical protein TUMSATVNIG1_14660 [Vibrio nigripulchritudo]|uniref:hypothetical protein n=1 Tax=Vibrio nigripulchritudo TaxID=28173 RepID=UPI00190A0724|nr:hypothetical protein [Vibrio nigripulchritudo]BCL69517.1 hypothetical protein VNTUMSATTG_14540 [Vibrio nigripulchritudo]BDU30857.1 hypothetical protein TUMSATVNIG1_14660 [Vibrio nigripulchritudo]